MKNETQGRKFAVVTGASSGIGFELAKEFANHNFDLLMVAEDEGIAECASSLSLQVDAQPLRADLRTRAGVEQVYEWIRLNSRAVDALALNAGVGLGGSFVTSDLQKELDLVQLNVSSVVHLARLLLPDMVARNQGRVLITSSMAALMPGPFFATYAASKSFLLSFSEALYNELKDSGVSVTALMPGATDTNFFARAGMLDTKVATAPKDDAAKVARQGFEAMMKGEDHVIGGSLKNRMEGVVAPFLTEQQKASTQRKQTEPGSAH